MNRHTIDATDKSIGRIATEVAHLLQGKNVPSYNPRLEGDNGVEVINASKVKIVGSKGTKKYYRHTGYLGNLKEISFDKAFAKDPAWVLRAAVYNMLPKNRLRSSRLKKLVIKL